MGVIRNSINVEGLAREPDLPAEVIDHIIKYSDVETLLIPSNKPEAKSIREINIRLNITDERRLNGAFGKTVVLGGIKNYKISYVENSPEATICMANIQEPFISCIDLPSDVVNTGKVGACIIDAYFHLINSRKIYAHFVYLIHIVKDNETLEMVEFERKDDIIFDNVISSETSNLLYDIEEEIL